MSEDDEPLSDLVAEVDEEDASADQERLDELAEEAADAEEAFRGPTDGRGGADDTVVGGAGEAVPAEDTAPGEADDPTPLSGVTEEVRRRRERGDDADDELFEEAFGEPVDDADEAALWEQLADDDVGGAVEEPSTDSERDVRVVDKREFCERCPYFSAPPEVACGHEGTDILEMEGTDRFKVADCPVVRGDESVGGPG